MEAREVENLDELNVRRKAELMEIAEKDEEKTEEEQERYLSIAERMMRRAQGKTFKLTFVDEKNDDEIVIEFRLLYSAERRDFLKTIQDLQELQEQDEVDLGKLDELIEVLKELVKAVTVTEGMDAYYDSEYCQDGDIYEIALAVMSRTIGMVEDARSFREERSDEVLPGAVG